MEWLYYDEENLQKCKIVVFDDGYQSFENKCDNSWYIIANNNRGKYKLQNIEKQDIILTSISCWKVEKLYKF